jgi:hypothetical protein
MIHQHHLPINFYGAEGVARILAEMEDPAILWAGGGKNRNLVHLISGAEKAKKEPFAVCGQWVGNRKRQPTASEKVCSKCEKGHRTAFSTFNQPRTCLACGKRFADSSRLDSTQETCPACYEEAGYENAHADGHHRDAPAEDCPLC